MDEWLQRVTQDLGLGNDLSDEDADALLKIARIAAHSSDDRRNAPILTYLVGRSGRPAAQILEALQRIS